MSPLPKAQPPAFPLFVSSYLVWVAVGPFGLLKSSFLDPNRAEIAGLDAYKELWKHQAEHDEDAILKLLQASDERRVICAPDAESEARWVEYPDELPGRLATLRFIAVLRRPLGIVYHNGFEDDSHFDLSSKASTSYKK